MEYTIQAHPTLYKGTLFRSRLEARWAAFFDLAGWGWEYEPIDLPGWTPDFRIEFRCGHSDCSPTHILLAEVKPHGNLVDFSGHACTRFPCGSDGDGHYTPACASACLGLNPSVTLWEMSHGSGGGIDDVPFWVSNWRDLWAEAGNRTRYLAPTAGRPAR